MNHYLVTISPKSGERIQTAYFQVFTPDWLGRNELFLTLKRHTPYQIEVYTKKHTAHTDSDLEKYKVAHSVEEIIDAVQQTVFYERKPVYAEVEEIKEVVPFKLSSCFTITEVTFNKHCYSLCNGITFFKIAKAQPIKDIQFDDTYLKETLGCNLAKSGFYFLHQEWRFFRSLSKPAYWEARRIERHQIKVGDKDVLLKR